MGCRECPRGTKAIASDQCDDGGCQFNDGMHLYDLSALKSTRFYGPVIVNQHTYEINVCSTGTHCILERPSSLTICLFQITTIRLIV